MKRFIPLWLAMVCLSAEAATHDNAITTATPSAMTNIIRSLAANDTSNTVHIVVYPNGYVSVPPPLAPPDTSASLTAGVQEAFDAFPRVTDMKSGVGGGVVDFAWGEFILTTNVVIPNYYPFSLIMDGCGMNETRFRYQGPTNHPAFGMATNHTVLDLTNSLTLLVRNCGFSADAYLATNFLWFIQGQNYCRFDHCLFTCQYGLTNGNSTYTLNFEGNVPDQPMGLVGIAAGVMGAAGDANATLFVDDCVFYCLACGIVESVTICRIRNNYFADCGTFGHLASTLPDAYCTNLWRGQISSSRGAFSPVCAAISVGAAIVGDGQSCEVSGNDTFSCGALMFADPWGRNSTLGDTIYLHANRQSVGKYRILTQDAGEIVDVFDFGYTSGGGPLPDSKVTNSTVVVQPNGVVPSSAPIMVEQWLNLGDGSADGAFVFTGAKVVADISGATNASATTLFSGGTVPTARLGSGSATAATLLLGNSTWGVVPIAALPGITNFPAYATGTIYTMTATPALLDFGTTDPSVTINQTGTYLLTGGASFEYRGATYAATNAVTVKFRKTNGTAADVTSATRSCLLNVVTTLSGPAGYVSVPPAVFTATSGDVIQVWGSVQATPAAGSMACDSAEIMAVRLY